MMIASFKIRRSAKPTVFFVLGTLLWFISLGLVLYELDCQHYMNAKRDLIAANSQRFFPPPDELAEIARSALFASGRYQENARRVLAEKLNAIVFDSSSSVFSFQLISPDGEVVLDVRNPGKRAALNTWRNSLFLRNFDGRSSQNISRANMRIGEPRIVGRLTFHYTSPLQYKPIDELTGRYRLYAGVIALIGMVGYYFLYRYILRPVQKVAANVERSKTQRPELIWRAKGPLEKSYNNIASQALLQQLQKQLQQMTRIGSVTEKGRILEQALEFVREAFAVERVAVIELSGTPDDFSVLDQISSPPEPAANPAAFPRDFWNTEPGEEHHFRTQADGSFIYSDDVSNSRLFVTGKLRHDIPNPAFRFECLRQVCHTLRGGLLGLRVHQQTLFRERSEANIVLSKNLGHDLTNIIATSKLDLMAIRKLLGTSGMPEGGPKADLLREAVEGVLESTKFLQEIVNIYRSFSYVKRPQYERHHLNELVEQFLQAFEPSISSRIRLERALAIGLPSLILEPRLLKLALFNVLTNALDAIKRDTRGDTSPPAIVVRTSHDAPGGAFSISVEDNGPGIRDEKGRLLDRAELDKIFQFGYSTKSESSEGLGLSWVRTIIEDFHSGSVHAENLPGGGARIILVIRSMDVAEARIREKTGNTEPSAKLLSPVPMREQGKG